MRFQRYMLNEENDDLFDTLMEDCHLFIDNFMKKYNTLLYRGSTGSNNVIEQKKVRKNRKPKDTPFELHKEIDWIFKKYYGWNVRSNSAFATPSYKDAIAYGNPYLFFPIGKYDFVHSPRIEDLYSFFNETNVYIDDYNYCSLETYFSNNRNDKDDIKFSIGNTLNKGNETIDIDIKNFIGITFKKTKIDVKDKSVNGVFNEIKEHLIESLNNVIKKYYVKNKYKPSKSEIAFNCKSYYIVSNNMEDDIRLEYGIRG